MDKVEHNKEVIGLLKHPSIIVAWLLWIHRQGMSLLSPSMTLDRKACRIRREIIDGVKQRVSKATNTIIPKPTNYYLKDRKLRQRTSFTCGLS
jgi:hypothetical protein